MMAWRYGGGSYYKYGADEAALEFPSQNETYTFVHTGVETLHIQKLCLPEFY